MRAMVANIVASLNMAGAFPTWALYLIMRPWVPKRHAWRRGERFSLRDWHAHEPPLFRILDVILVASVADLALFVALLAIS